MFTAAEIQLSPGFPGEGDLGEGQEALGLFLEGIRGGSMTEVRTGKDRHCRSFGSCSQAFCQCGKAEAERFIRVTFIYNLCSCI